jgi:hypothetical protein
MYPFFKTKKLAFSFVYPNFLLTYWSVFYIICLSVFSSSEEVDEQTNKIMQPDLTTHDCCCCCCDVVITLQLFILAVLHLLLLFLLKTVIVAAEGAALDFLTNKFLRTDITGLLVVVILQAFSCCSFLPTSSSSWG